MRKPSVAVIIVGYESGKWLEGCLRSLRADIAVEQEPDDADEFRFIYVDNASPDNALQVVSRFPVVRVIANTANVGFGAANNIGAEMAAGLGADVLVFLNADVLARRDQLIAIAETIWNSDSIGIVGPLQREWGVDQQLYNDWSRRAVTTDFYPPDELQHPAPSADSFSTFMAEANSVVDVSYVNGACLAIRTKLFEEVGGFCGLYFLYFDEVELCRRVRHRGPRTVVRTDVTVAHAWNGLSSLKLSHHWYRSRVIYLLLDPVDTLGIRVLKLLRRASSELIRPPQGKVLAYLTGTLSATLALPKIWCERRRWRTRSTPSR